ncbi:MAG: hypothetical protein IJR83_06285 [Clostridia bacterium]|nr:hypothetical protein [Clostridia bacterium]
MPIFTIPGLRLETDAECRQIRSLCLKDKDCCAGGVPLFSAKLRDRLGESVVLDATDAKTVCRCGDTVSFSGFKEELRDLCVDVTIREAKGIEWGISFTSVPEQFAVEWIDFPKIRLRSLGENDPEGGRILYPYNEGVLISDERRHQTRDPEYPSGNTVSFPGMLCSQFIAYVFPHSGLYMGAHDPERGLKHLDFSANGAGVLITMRLYTGACFGQDFRLPYPVIWKACPGGWRSAAAIYREWFEQNLPPNVRPACRNPSLPKWYEGLPLVVTYPVRGIHDMDRMDPNAFFPYTAALPALNRIKKATSAQIMALLMHWEGTAPWAPPYVWPPYGGEEPFFEFRDALHESGDLLGVYCSGFGYTIQSNLIQSYNNQEKIRCTDVLLGMCRSPQDEVGISHICTAQRSGYDICAASEGGRKILDEAYTPLFSSGIDYAQILDQNHGGSQCLCYARDHGHPPMPGVWMTSSMQRLLTGWNEQAPKMLFGCESAAAEPFIGNLALSDNRYELNYQQGEPVPLFAFLYHEYARNFMGNQVCCGLDTKCDTLRYRLAYSFSIGDLMTLTLSPNGSLMTHWGTRDFEHSPDMDNALELIKNLTAFYNAEGKKYLFCGRMSCGPDVICDRICVPLASGEKADLPRLHTSCWEAGNGKTAVIVVNPETEEVPFSVGKKEYRVGPLDAVLVTV